MVQCTVYTVVLMIMCLLLLGTFADSSSTPDLLTSRLPLVLQSAQSSSLPVVQTVLSTVYYSLPFRLFSYHLVILCTQGPSDLSFYSIMSISCPVQTSKLLWISAIPPLILVSYCPCFLLSLFPIVLVSYCPCIQPSLWYCVVVSSFICIIMDVCRISLSPLLVLVIFCPWILSLLCSYTLLIVYPRLFVIGILCLLVLDSFSR